MTQPDQVRDSTPPVKLGRNHGGYHGERTDIDAVLDDDLRAAREEQWHIETLGSDCMARLYAFSRTTGNGARRLYVSTGVHGDEPAGPLAIRQLLLENRWPADVSLCVLPCLNASGFRLNRRENAAGLDLNRDYRHLQTDEVRAHVEWLQRQPAFDCAICVHEDWEAQGFYLYELNPDARPSAAGRVIDAVRAICPIDPSLVIEGRPATGGIIRPNLDPTQRPQWPEAFYLITHMTRQSYTLEAPSDYPLEVRVAALVGAIRTLLEPGLETAVDHARVSRNRAERC